MAKRDIFRFRLYVAGDAQNSSEALTNLSALCREHLADRNEVDIVDVLREPQRALADGIFLTPTLIKLTPLPIQRIVGSLSQTGTVMHALGLGAQSP